MYLEVYKTGYVLLWTRFSLEMVILCHTQSFCFEWNMFKPTHLFISGIGHVYSFVGHEAMDNQLVHGQYGLIPGLIVLPVTLIAITSALCGIQPN